ncbi:MAG: hypothetical protein ACRYFX_26000 [Janthinobacterium lividum]
MPHLLLLAGAGPLLAQAQNVPPPTRWTPSLYFDNRNPFEQAAAVRVIGLNLGVVPPGKKYRVGISGYTLRRNYGEYYATKGRGRGQNPQAGLAMPGLSLLYFTPSFTYTLVRRRFFEVSIPLDVGIGRSHYTVTDAQDQLVTDTRDTFVPAEAGVGLLLKPTRWVGVSGGVGYRVSLTHESFEDDFNGWYYCYRLNLFVGTIWADLRHHRRRLAQP